MNKLLTLFLISLLFASSLAEENFRNLGKKWHNQPTATVVATPNSENVAVTVEEENTGDNVPIDLGTTTTTKSWDNPDGSHIKQVITVEKTCLNGITTTKTTTKTYTYTNVNTVEAPEGGQGENVVVVVPTEEEEECETTTTVVSEAEANSENVVVTVEQGEAEENIPINLGTKTITKSWDNTDGSHVKQVITIEKTCLNGIITTKTTTKTYTYTYSQPSTSTPEEAVESESEVEVYVEAPESVEVEVAVIHEQEYESEAESNIVVVESGESTGANVAVEVEQNVPKYLGTTTITKSWDTANGCHIVQVITKERTCLNGVITIKTTTKTYTYTNVSSHEEEVEAEHETEIVVVAEEEEGENVVVVVPTEEAECETTTTVHTEPVGDAGENVAVEVESAEENVVKNLGTTTTTKSWTNSEGCYVKQVITVEKTCLNGVITTKTTTKTYTYPKGGSWNSGKKWR